MDTVFNYMNFLLFGYSISTIIFLLATLFVKRFKTLKSDYLDIANLFALFLAVAVTLITAINYYKNQIAIPLNDLFPPDHRNYFYTAIFLTGVMPLLFLDKRLRKNIVITLIVVACVSWFLFNERLYIWITHYYREYLPANSPIPYIVAATIIYFAAVFILAEKKKKRLPNQ